MRTLLPVLLAACGGPSTPSADAAAVRWISIFASDYDLELEPEFDPAITTYTAQADEAGIIVFAEVVFSGGDAVGVRVNELDAAPSGYRTWLSPQEQGFEAPLPLEVQIDLGEGSGLSYAIEVTIP